MLALLTRLTKHKSLIVILLLSWLGFLSAMSLIPYDSEAFVPEIETGFRIDYLQHFAGYLALGLLISLWRMNRNFRISIAEVLFFTVLGFSFSFLLEYAQVFIPGRSYNTVDVFYNVTGLITGILFAWLVIGALLRLKTSRS